MKFDWKDQEPVKGALDEFDREKWVQWVFDALTPARPTASLRCGHVMITGTLFEDGSVQLIESEIVRAAFPIKKFNTIAEGPSNEEMAQALSSEEFAA